MRPLLSHHFNLTVELPLKAIMRGFSYAIVPTSWTNRAAGTSKLQLNEMGSRYLFIVLYVFLEYHLSRGDYRRAGAIAPERPARSRPRAAAEHEGRVRRRLQPPPHPPLMLRPSPQLQRRVSRRRLGDLARRRRVVGVQAGRAEVPRQPSAATRWLVGALGVYALALAARGWRWHRIMRLAEIPHERADAYRLTLVGYMGNNVLPARGGEVLRIAILGSRTTAKRRTILGSIIAERILDAAVLAALFARADVVRRRGRPGRPVARRGRRGRARARRGRARRLPRAAPPRALRALPREGAARSRAR